MSIISALYLVFHYYTFYVIFFCIAYNNFMKPFMNYDVLSASLSATQPLKSGFIIT